MNTKSSFDITNPELVAELKDRVQGLNGVATSFLGGSLIEGFGNSASDIDLLVLTEEAFTAEETSLSGLGELFSFPTHHVLVSSAQNRRLDVEFRSTLGLRDITDRLAAPLERQDTFEGTLDQGWLEFLNDLRIGVPVTNDSHFERYRESVDWSALGRLLVARYENQANGFIEDAAGAIDEGDVGLALFTSRAALDSALDAFLASKGATNPKPKWRFRKLLATGLTSTYERSLELSLDTSSASSDVLNQAKRRITYAQDLILDAHT